MGTPHLFHKIQEKHKTKIKPWPHNPYSKQLKLVINITVSQTPKSKKCHPLRHYHLLYISTSIDLELSDPRFLYGPGEISSFSSQVFLLQILYVQNPPIPIKIIMAPPAARYPIIAATTLVFFFPPPSNHYSHPHYYTPLPNSYNYFHTYPHTLHTTTSFRSTLTP